MLAMRNGFVGSFLLFNKMLAVPVVRFELAERPQRNRWHRKMQSTVRLPVILPFLKGRNTGIPLHWSFILMTLT